MHRCFQLRNRNDIGSSDRIGTRHRWSGPGFWKYLTSVFVVIFSARKIQPFIYSLGDFHTYKTPMGLYNVKNPVAQL